MNYERIFGFEKNNNKNLLDELYRPPRPDKGVDMPRFQQVVRNHTHQADILYLPHDDGNKYLLVVVDVGSRHVDAEPLKSRTSEDTLSAIKKMYKRKHLDQPKRIEVDAGSEFKNKFSKWCHNKNIVLRVAKTGRHRQQAIVERMNQTIGKALYYRMNAQELLTYQVSKEWVEDLPHLIKILNKRADKRKPIKLKNEILCKDGSCHILPIGTKVRAVYDEPRNIVDDKVWGTKFRSTDLRFNPKIRTIMHVSLKPNSPPLYILDGHGGQMGYDSVAYTKNQLRVVHKNELLPSRDFIRGKQTKYVVEKIIGKKKKNDKIFYKVLWRGYNKDEATWEPRSSLIKQVPESIAAFENKNN